MRAALYARYSSERQDERSIKDQLRLCREHAASMGATVAAEFTDYAMTGAHLRSRPGVLALVEAATGGAIDAVIAEGLDRLSRDQEDIAWLYKRLTHAGVAIVTLAEGAVDELHVGFKGTMNALYLKGLAAQIRRGQRGRIAEGRAAGGLSYGYRMVRRIGPDGELVRGLREIDPGQAQVVRRIFKDYARGISPREIAKSLNAAGTRAPRGGLWNMSTIVGNRARRNGILHNELYAGRLIYNRERMVRDPDTGRRVHRLNPRAEWVTTQVPALRIVDAATWRAVQDLKSRYGNYAIAHRRRPKRLLSGLVECGACGGPATLVRPGRYGCTANRQRGTCANGATIAAAELESRALDGLASLLLDPEAVAEYARTLHAEIGKGRAQAARQARQDARRLDRTAREIERLVDAITDGADTPAVRARLVDLEATKARLAAEQDAAGDGAGKVIEFHPKAPDLYRRRIGELREALARDAAKPEAAAILRSLVARLVISPTEKRGRVAVELHGRLGEALALAHPDRVVKNGGNTGVLLVVAGEGTMQYYTPPLVIRV